MPLQYELDSLTVFFSALTQCQTVTDRQTDISTIAKSAKTALD